MVGLIGSYLGWTLAPSRKNNSKLEDFVKNRSDAIKDIEFTVLRTYRKLEKASEDNELLTRSMSVGTALAACGGAIRDVHGIPFEEESLSMNLLIALKVGDYSAIEKIMADVKEISENKDLDEIKINYMIYLSAPSSLKFNNDVHI